MTVTAVGCGDVNLATAAARGVDRGEVERALHEALGFGITFLEAAAESDSERLCGTAVRSLRLRDRAALASRVLMVEPRPGAPKRDRMPERMPAAYVQERIEATLRATRLDVLPLAQLELQHTWLGSTAWPELAGTCERLVREGKVLHWGAILDELTGAEDFVAEPWLASIQVTYNACSRLAAPLLDAAHDKLAILARRPLAGGALAGFLGPGVRLTPRDDRRVLEDAELEQIAVGVALLAPLVSHEPVAARSCDAAKAVLERGRRPDLVEAVTLADLALRYVIDRDLIAIPRLHRREHLLGTIGAASAPPLTAATRARLDELLGT